MLPFRNAYSRMKNVKKYRYYAILSCLFLLAGCQTSPPVISSEELTPEKKRYYLGYMVSYNELCSQFYSNGADDGIVSDVKNRFAGDIEFQSGYDQNSSYKAYDSLTGLDMCKEMRELLVKIHAQNTVSN